MVTLDWNAAGEERQSQQTFPYWNDHSSFSCIIEISTCRKPISEQRPEKLDGTLEQAEKDPYAFKDTLTAGAPY
jgi:hypothetical protein